MLCIISMLFVGCADQNKPIKKISCDEIADAYEAAGYEVFHNHQAGFESYDCYVRATDTQSGDYIYILNFDSAQAAKEYAESRKFNVLLWLFTVIYGDPSWLHTTTYDHYEIEYDNASLYDPFAKLIE